MKSNAFHANLMLVENAKLNLAAEEKVIFGGRDAMSLHLLIGQFVNAEETDLEDDFKKTEVLPIVIWMRRARHGSSMINLK